MGSEAKVIWIINQYASHLETRHLELAKSFAQQGYRVAIITSSFHHGRHEYLYDVPVQLVERSENVFYAYLHSEPEYHNNGSKRVLNMLDFCRRFSLAQNEIEQRTGKPCFVIGSSAHPFVWESAWTCAKRYNAKFIAEFRDIWPLSLVEVQGVNPRHPFVILLGLIEKRAYRRADAIVSTLEYAYKHVCEVSGVSREKVYWIPNGINTAETDRLLMTEAELPEELRSYVQDHWCCVYAGSIAKCECIDYLLKTFCSIRDEDIFLAIIGDGPEKNRLKALSDQYKLENVRFFPAVSKNQVHAILQYANCCIAAVPDLPLYHFGLSVNKLNDYLYSGKPVVIACNTENIVSRAGHFTVPFGEPQALAEKIKAVKELSPEQLSDLSERGKKLIRDEYDLNTNGVKYLKMMESL